MKEINFIKGDLVQHLLSDDHFTAYAHQCNSFCRMGRGIAPQLAKAVPGLREADNETTPGDRSKMGTFTYSAHYNGSVVFNIYGQYHWKQYPEDPKTGRNTCYDSLRLGLTAVRNALQEVPNSSLGLPLIGCGLAGGDWENVVLPMIKDIFEESSVEVTIFIL